MEFIDRILILLKRDKITKNKMLMDLSLSKNSFVNWNERGNTPNGETLRKIADYFGVTTDYLLGRTDEPNQPSDDDLLNLLRKNKSQATIIGFGDGRHIKTDMTYEDFEELEAMWRALKEKREK